MKKTVYRWKVVHPIHLSVEVDGVNKYEAIIAAAKCWGVPWTSVARECSFEKLEEVEP